MKKKEGSHTTDQSSVIVVPSDWAEAMFVRGKLDLTQEQIEQLSLAPTITVHAANMPPQAPREPRKPQDFFPPLEAVHWLSQHVGGDANAKRAISERLRDRTIACSIVWVCEGLDVGALPTRRPKVSDDPCGSEAIFWVAPPAPKPGLHMLGDVFWTYSSDWENDLKRWDWRNGMFVVSREDAATAKIQSGSGETRTIKLSGRMVACGVHFCRTDIEKIVVLARAPQVPSEIQATDSLRKTKSPNRKRGDDWNDWVAEVSIITHEEGFDNKISAEKYYSKIADRLLSRNIDSPSFTTVDAAIRAIKRRWIEYTDDSVKNSNF